MSEGEKTQKTQRKKDGMTFAEKIKEMREAEGVSQGEFAARLNVSRQSVSNWENGLSVPRRAQREKIFTILGIDVTQYIREEISEEQSQKTQLPPQIREERQPRDPDPAVPNQNPSFERERTSEAAVASQPTEETVIKTSKKETRGYLPLKITISVFLAAVLTGLLWGIWRIFVSQTSGNGPIGVAMDVTVIFSGDTFGLFVFCAIFIALSIAIFFIVNAVWDYRKIKTNEKNNTKGKSVIKDDDCR